ncbi:MAG: EAL domain-containing protein [Planctomycetes bacterium]|nr:EAL domain-containing protein [Planctomycetota bacterium]
MKAPGQALRRRVLVIDDTESVHDSFRKIFECSAPSTAFAAAKAALFAEPAESPGPPTSALFELDFAYQGEEGVQKAAQARAGGEPYMVTFVDMRMPPGWDGTTTIKRLWEVDPDVQVVVCTAYSDDPLEKLAQELGHAHQLLILKKPFDPVEVQQLASALSEKRLAHQAAALKMEELERLVQERTAEIEHALLHDKLTGLPNRTMVLTRLDACIQRRRRNPATRFAVLFLDFDRFKLVNDSLGHELGDVLLIEIAGRLRNSLRTADVAAHSGIPSRLGGDEFIVLLEDLREERDAARAAQRLLDSLSEPYLLENQKLVITVSIGIATSDREYERSGDMLRDADTAMYRAKAAGRARYVMFDRTMHAEVSERLFLETALRKAVRDDELFLHYQPIMRLDTGALTGFEALARWTLPERGAVAASTLIAIAEETGLIQPLTVNLLHRACRQLRTWRERFPAAGNLMMSVNFSRRLVLDPEIVGRIADIIREEGIDPRSLILEITENGLLGEREHAGDLLERLRKLGVWLHLDDFGTGYSSLSCLYTLPLSGIKIDRSFVKEVCSRPQQSAVLQAIVNIASALELAVVIEGIETSEQLQLIKSLNVRLGQGYLFGAPSSPETAEALLRDLPTLCYA